ncbi:MAG: hypothetical protein Q4B70_18470, partial [Lachnospiraceae bacterium]|nr:hypothetical protein [Lachnospiraceae bacterium]
VLFCFHYHIVDENSLIDNSCSQFFSGTGEQFFEQCFSLIIEKELLNPPWNKLIRKSLIDQNNIRFTPEFSICEDMAFSIDLLRNSNQLILNNKAYYNYFLKSSGTLVFKFHENYFEALTDFYNKAKVYCNRYENHQKQRNEIDSLYSRLTMMYLKMISCYDGWNKEKKQDRIRQIIKDDTFRKALDASTLNHKKRIMKGLIKAGAYRMIYAIYSTGHSK